MFGVGAQGLYHTATGGACLRWRASDPASWLRLHGVIACGDSGPGEEWCLSQGHANAAAATAAAVAVRDNVRPIGHTK